MAHDTLGQSVTNKHGVDGLQIVLRREVHYGEIFVVEFAVLLGRIAVALNQVVEQVAVGLDVTIEIHADEAVQLQKSRIYVTHYTRLRERHLGDDVAPEPIGAAGLRKGIDAGRIDARIYWTAHQHHGMWHTGVLDRLHAGDRSEHRHRRLTHRDDMDVAAEKMQDRDHVVDVIVEIEAAFDDRNHASVSPIRDVDIVIGQKRLNGASQQRRIMA